MKCEARGKYPGVKLHLDRKETEELLDLRKKLSKANGTPSADDIDRARKMLKEWGKEIESLMKENPRLLEERTDEEKQAALSREAVSAQKKLEALGKGLDISKIKVTVEKGKV